jgi:general secretion pathway protein M
MISKLDKREKILVGAVAGLLAIVLVHSLVLSPLANWRSNTQARVLQQEADMARMGDLAAQYQALVQKQSQALNRYAGRDEGFSLFTYLDRLAEQADVQRFRTYIKPSTSPVPDSPFRRSLVEMKLAGLSMEQLMAYLFAIESSKNQISISRIAITETGRDSRLVEAVLHVSTLEK